MPKSKTPSFEEAFEELDKTVERLEAGDIPLEDSISLFERGMKLAAEHRKHVHPGERLALEQDGDVMTIDFDADRFFKRDGAGLMRRLIEHGSETEELAGRGLINDDFLVILIHGSNPYGA